ncbi:hypothetical protein [Phaeodactylibacter xiamenensis]|uniref:hypothetical protein n=1 Tax=Phaeodactylibacter xiamenensis TaxID=1524460 RepID=UPI0024A7FB9F|nr:hypothetical protein [Phaeodactylibacter xiamenensis]
MPNPRNLINGQKPEFGNPEHIEYANRVSRAIERYRETGEINCKIDVREETVIRVQVVAKFICVECGKENRLERIAETEDTPVQFDNVGMVCPRCKSKYLVDLHEETITKQQ